MGRQLRKVPANWEHPKDSEGEYKPLYDGSFKKRLSEWEEGKKQWDNGFRENFDKPDEWQPREKDELEMTYEDWSGEIPKEELYMPEWSDEEKTHIQLYENTSEGTPLSPIFKPNELEKLCEWASENTTTFGDFTASKEEWMKMLIDNNVHAKEGNVIFM